jgi:hypothetical protein
VFPRFKAIDLQTATSSARCRCGAARRSPTQPTFRSPGRLEISPPEGHAGSESQLLEAISIEDFGLIGPDTVRCLSIRYQIAQERHACTEVFPAGRENDCFRDLVDLLLLRALDPNLVAIRLACLDIFSSRAKHSWSPSLMPPASWSEPYARLAREFEFSVVNLDEAVAAVRDFIAEIDAAIELVPSPPRPGQTCGRADGVRVEIQEADSTRLVVNEQDPTTGPLP